MPDEEPIKDMTMLELLANQVDQEPVERAQQDQPGDSEAE